MTTNGALHVRRKVLHNGIEISLGRKDYVISYPPSIWKEFPDDYRQNFADYLTYSMTVHLCFNGVGKIIYNFPWPAIEPYIFESMIYSLGETEIVGNEKLSMSELIKIFYNRNLNIEFVGRPRFSRIKAVGRNTKNRAVIPFSFGKDSLLTFALCQELGIEAVPIFFQEPKSPFENRHKSKLADKFAKEFAIDVTFFPVSVGRLRHNDGNYWGWDLLFTQYTLMSIPYIFGTRAKYLFWSHEQDCNAFFEDAEGYSINPVFEQSSRWMLTLNNVARNLGSNVIMTSPIEPISEMATTWILHHRYPHIAKYQFSCFAEEAKKSGRRWCGICEKCATIYLFFMALGIDPKKVNFKESMFDITKKNLYVMFDPSGRKDDWRDEQLLAFYMAYKKGAKGKLIDYFKKNNLKEAKSKYKQLKSKFFGIHTFSSLPYELKNPLLKIYAEELLPLQ